MINIRVGSFPPWRNPYNYPGAWLVRCHGFPSAREWRSKSFGQKLHGDAIDAIAQAGRRRPVIEDVAQMAAAAAAVHLRTDHAVAFVRRGLHRTGRGIIEARPAGAAFEFPLRDEQRLIAPRTNESAGPLLEVERAAAGRLGAVLAHDLVLLGRQQLAPLRLGPGDRILLGVHLSLPCRFAAAGADGTMAEKPI